MGHFSGVLPALGEVDERTFSRGDVAFERGLGRLAAILVVVLGVVHLFPRR